MLVDDRDRDHRGIRIDHRIFGSGLTSHLVEPAAHLLHHLWPNAMSDRFFFPCDGGFGIGLIEGSYGLA